MHKAINTPKHVLQVKMLILISMKKKFGTDRFK